MIWDGKPIQIDSATFPPKNAEETNINKPCRCHLLICLAILDDEPNVPFRDNILGFQATYFAILPSPDQRFRRRLAQESPENSTMIKFY